MKHSRAALGVLKNRYISVLKKCALINAAFLFMVPPAAAVDVGRNDWNGFINAIAGTDSTVNITGNIDRRLPGSNSQITLGADKTINGNDHDVSGRYAGKSAGILIGNGQELTINNLILHQFTQVLTNNGTVNINGGSLKDNEKQAIYNNGTLHISGTTISNNSGETNQDAAIYNNGGTVYINGATFSDNTSYNGGALANAGGMIVIENSTFDGNSSEGNGGAIDTWGGTTTIIDSTFTNNHANDSFNLTDWANRAVGATTYGGGAINNNDRGTLNIVAQNDDVEFTGNYVGNSTDYALAITNNGTINLNASAGHSIVFNDAIGYSQGSSRETNIININKSDVELKNSAGETITTPTEGTILVNNYIFDQTINLYGGTLKFGTEGYIDATENHHSNLNVYGGSIDTINGEAGYTGVGWVTAYNDIDFALDADASINFADHYDAQGHYKPGKEDARLYISKISILNSTDNRFVGEAVDTENNNGSWEWFNVREDAELVDGNGDKIEGNTLVAWNKETGILKAGKYNLKNAVSDNTTININAQGSHRENVKVDENSDRVYRLEEDEIVTEDLGDMTNGSLTIAGKGNNITAQPADKTLSGITVGAGDTLEINDVAAMQGFDTALNVTGGTVSVNNSGLTGNTTALNVTGGTVSLDNSDITNNTTGLSVSGGSATLTDSNIVGNDKGLTVSGSTVNINASAGESAENQNTVAIDNTNDIANNSGTINFNAFANAVIEVADNVIGTVGNLVNNALNINMAENASGTVNLANVEGQTVNINKGTVTMDKATGSDVNITTGDIDITAVDNSTVDVTDGTADFGTVSNNSTVTIADGTADFNDNIASSTLALNGGTNTIADGKTVSDSKITVATGATANIAADLNDSDIITAGNTTISGDVTNTSTITANADTTISGAVSDSTINANGGKTTISAAVADSTLSVGTNGALEVAATGNISGSTVNTAGTTTINGNVEENSQLDVTGGTTTVAGTVSDSDVNVSGGTANLQGNVTGTTLAQSNTGTLNLGTEGKEISLAGSTINSGTANLLASTITGGANGAFTNGAFTIDTGATLATTKEATIAASINGNGTISATGNELTFSTNDNASGSAFAGAISAGNGATVNLDSSYGLSTDATVSLDNSILNYDTTQTMLSDASLFNLALNGKATANIIGSGRETANITLTDKFWTMGADTANNTLNFNDAHYTLAENFSTDGDTVRFDNADISLKGTNYENSNLTLNDSALQLSNRKAGDEYKFGNLISENNSAEITLDVNLAYDADVVDSNPVADTIEYADGSSGELNITELFITDDNGAIGQAGTDGKTIQILDGDGSLKLRPSDGMEILSWATNVYEYGVESAKTAHEADSINIAMDRPSSSDTLRDLNRYIGGEGNTGNIRGFSFIAERDDEGNITDAGSYNIYRDLDATSAGTFTILGNDVNGSKSVLSGELEALTIAESSTRYEKNDDGTYTYYEAHEDEDGNKVVDTSDIAADKVTIAESSTKPGENDITFAVGAMGNDSGEGARGSMFEIVNETKFTIRDVSVEKALRQASDKITDGAAIYASNAAAEVTLENTDFKNNEVKGGNGGAIANIKSAVFNIANALFSGNKASANGGAIYNAAEMTIDGATFENNAAQNGGAIYNDTDGTMTINGATFENNATGTDGKGGAIYNAGTMTFEGEVTLAAATTAEDGTVTASNDIYNTGTLNLNGTTELNSAVTNDETLKVNGKTTLNNNISGTGDMFVNSSELELADTATIAQNTLTLAEAVELAVNADQLKISEALNNAGTLTFTGGTNTSAITGEGTLNITGEVTNNATIGQDALTIAATTGSLTTNAGNLTITNGITNNGTLTFTGGKNANNISGEGTLNITDNVINADTAEIKQSGLEIAKDGRFKTLANLITLTGDNPAIQNDGTLTFTGGDNANKVSGTGTLIINGEVVNNAQITQNSLLIDTLNNATSLTTDAGLLDIENGINNTETLIFTGGNNKNTIVNNGTMEYQGMGTNTGAISGSMGTLNITGNITNNATIAQKELAIAGAGSDAGTSAGSLTTNAGKLTIANGITNSGTLTFTGGSNNNAITNNGNFEYQGTGSNTGAITGTGTTTISGTVTNGENGSIKQNAITIADSGSLTTAADKIALNDANSAIANNGTLTFTGGTNNNAITGSGTTTISGTVTNNATIGQDVAIAANEDGTKGNLTNTGTISGVVTNAGTLDNTTGTITGDVTNSGILNNSGTLGGLNNQSGAEAVNTGTISGDVTNSGTLTSAAENLKGNIANNAGGTLNLSGTLGKDVSGDGTTNINGELAFESNAGIDGTLNMNKGTLDLSKENTDNDDKSTEHNIGKLTGTGTIKIDGDLSDNNGKSDSLNIDAAGEGTTVKIDSINIFADHVSENPDETVSKVMNVITGDGASGVTLELAENMSTMTSDYKYDFKVHDTISGAVEAVISKTTNGLAEFIQGINDAEKANTYSMTRNETSMDIPPEAIGTTGSRADGSTALNLNMNGHTLSGNGNNGITVAEGFILNVNGDEGTVANFNTAFAVKEGGKLILDNVTFKGNETDVANNGELNLSGSNIIEGGITGSGSTIITGGKTEVVASIEQGSLTVNTGATLEGSAANLTIKNGITNAGTVNFTGGENNNAISNTGTITFGKDEDIGAVASNNGKITGTGTVNMTDGSANSGTIKQGTINIAANATVTNTGTMSADKALTVNTGATVTNTGGTLSGKLDNDGTISGGSVTAAEGSVNDGTISATVTADGDFTNNNKIEGSVTANSGKLTNAGEINTGTNGEVEIASAAEFANNGTIIGDVANNGTFTNAGEVRDVTNNAGGTFTNTGTAGNVTNAGTFENTGTAGNVTNTGTFTNTGTIADLDNEKGATATTTFSRVTGSIDNDGTLNLTDAEATLDKKIAGAGTTSISGAVTLGENGGFDEAQSLHVNEDATLDIAANTITLNNFTLKGQLNLAITDISANSSEYKGGKILVNSADLTGGKMQFTVGKGLLSGKQQTDELAIIDRKDGATGTIEGDLSDIFYDNNLYEISRGETAGTVIITNVATAQEVITGIGNQNQINTAGAWENIVTEDGTAVGDIQEALNTLVQHDIPEYLEALTNLAPTDSQFRLQNAKEAQNLIGRQIALRLDSSDCPTCKDPFRKTAMWMQGLGGYAKQDNRFDAAGYSAYTGGYAIGYDGNVNCDTTVGFGYAYTTTDGESHGRDMDVSAHNLFAYGKYQPSAWYLRGAFTYGAAKYDEKSDVAGHSVTAKYDVHYTGLEAALGHDFANGLTPEFGLRATHLMPDDYEDSLGQKVTNKDVFALSAAALLKYRNTYELNEYTVRPNVYAGLTYDLTDDGSNTAVRINEMNYDIIGKRLPRLGGEAGFAVEVSHDNIDLSVGYDMGYREDYISHTGMIKLRYNFN